MFASLVLVIFLIENGMSQYVAQSSPSLIDTMRKDYLKVEKNLWQFIDNSKSDLDTIYVLEQVHLRHESFFKTDFAVKKVFLSILDPREHGVVNAIQSVDSAVEVLLGKYLHNDSADFSETEAVMVSRHQIHFVKEIDGIYNVTGLSDFFTEVRNVGIF